MGQSPSRSSSLYGASGIEAWRRAVYSGAHPHTDDNDVNKPRPFGEKLERLSSSVKAELRRRIQKIVVASLAVVNVVQDLLGYVVDRWSRTESVQASRVVVITIKQEIFFHSPDDRSVAEEFYGPLSCSYI